MKNLLEYNVGLSKFSDTDVFVWREDKYYQGFGGGSKYRILDMLNISSNIKSIVTVGYMQSNQVRQVSLWCKENRPDIKITAYLIDDGRYSKQNLNSLDYGNHALAKLNPNCELVKVYPDDLKLTYLAYLQDEKDTLFIPRGMFSKAAIDSWIDVSKCIKRYTTLYSNDTKAEYKVVCVSDTGACHLGLAKGFSIAPIRDNVYFEVIGIPHCNSADDQTKSLTQNYQSLFESQIKFDLNFHTLSREDYVTYNQYSVVHPFIGFTPCSLYGYKLYAWLYSFAKDMPKSAAKVILINAGIQNF